MRYIIGVVLLVAVLLYGLSAGKAIIDNAADKMQRTELVE